MVLKYRTSNFGRFLRYLSEHQFYYSLTLVSSLNFRRVNCYRKCNWRFAPITINIWTPENYIHSGIYKVLGSNSRNLMEHQNYSGYNIWYNFRKIWSIHIRDCTHVWNKKLTFVTDLVLGNSENWQIWNCLIQRSQQNYENEFSSIFFLQLPCQFQK